MNIPYRKMRTMVLLLLLVATAGGAGVGIAFAFQCQRAVNLKLSIEATNARNQGDPGQKAIARKTAMNLFAFLEQALQKLPPGTQLDISQFDGALGADAGNYLRKAQVSKIAVKADLFTITLSQPRQIDLNGQADLRVAQKLTFRLDSEKGKSGSVIHLSQIHGVEVRVGWLLGFIDVWQIDITRDGTGATALVVTVDTLFGKKSRSFTIGADGKPKAATP